MMKLKKNDLVEKRNLLNEIRAKHMNLQELRFFAIYLSKINARDISTRVVRFPLEDFKAIMELEARLNIKQLKNTTNDLLGKVVNVPNYETGGWTAFQLFKECKVDIDHEWYVEIDAHDKALPLMFDFKRDYFNYRLFNALRLRSKHHLRLYELLKQREFVGEWIVNIEELKKSMWLVDGEYQRYESFRRRVLEPAKKALLECTDIKFTYAPYGRRGKGGQILELKFTIMENKDFVDQLNLDMFIVEQKEQTAEAPQGQIIELEQYTFEGLEEKQENPFDALKPDLSDEDAERLFAKAAKLADPQEIKSAVEAVDYYSQNNAVNNLPALCFIAVKEKWKLQGNKLKKKGVKGRYIQFNDFKQNEYDYEALERELVVNK